MVKIVVLSIFMLSYSGAANPSLYFKLSWGTSADQLKEIRLPEGVYGPQSFRIRNDSLFILDNGNQKLKIFIKGKLQKAIPAPRASRDFLYGPNDSYRLLIDNEVHSFGPGQSERILRPQKRDVIRTLFTDGKQRASLRLSDGRTLLLPQGNRLLKGVQTIGSLSADPDQIILSRLDGSSGLVQIKKNGLPTEEFRIRFPLGRLASLQWVGTDGKGRLFIHVELFEHQVPLKVRRQVRVYTAEGKLLAVVHMPVNSYTRIYRDLTIDDSGNLYQMISGPQGVEILKWDLKNLSPQSSATEYTYPSSYDRIPAHWPSDIREPGDNRQGAGEGLKKVTDFPPVTPDEALAIGDSYVQLHWDCNSANLTNGVITDSYGNHVETPGWLSVGTMQRVPYKWGGFNTIDGFLSGIADGKYAGDRATDSVSPDAVGVDCSGFVSRCWKLPQHYSTRMMDDYIAQPYESWDQTRPGDICHKPGHVRLIVGHEPNGSLDMVESAGFNWRVSYTNYFYYQITAYTPRYYINMQGTPGNIPQPTLALCDFGEEQTGLQWSANDRQEIANFHIELSEDTHTWQETIDMAVDSNNCHLDLPDSTAIYYRMTSIAKADSVSESLPSDTYGTYRLDGRARVLIVDGFDRTSSSQGSWPHPYHSFAAVWGRALQTNHIPFETAANEAVINGLVHLQDYPAVFWLLGDESTADETFDAEEQALVKSYLEQGGQLFVSGSEIAWDLDYKGSSADKDFFHQYLKSEYVEDNSGSYTVRMDAGEGFDSLTVHYDDGTHGVYEEDYPDVIKPLNGAQRAMTYANGKIAAVRFQGIFPGGSKSGVLFYMGFPLETIYTESERNRLMGAVTAYFHLNVTGLNPTAGLAAVKDFILQGNYPNPFNNQTVIRFETGTSGKLIVKVFNLLGQQVLGRELTITSAGRHRIYIDGGNWSSGTYFYRLLFKNKKRTQIGQAKFVLLK